TDRKRDGERCQPASLHHFSPSRQALSGAGFLWTYNIYCCQSSKLKSIIKILFLYLFFVRRGTGPRNGTRGPEAANKPLLSCTYCSLRRSRRGHGFTMRWPTPASTARKIGPAASALGRVLQRRA